MHFSNYLENALINHLLRNTSLTSPASVYLALATSGANDGATFIEVSGNPYVRQSGTFAGPDNGSGYNSVAMIFPEATELWGTITHVGLYDASISGNQLFWGDMDVFRTVESGTTLTFPVSGVIVTLQ